MTALDNLPGVAEVAMQGGLHSARTIVRRVHGDDRSIPFKYRDLGNMATIGRYQAVLSVGKLRMSGFPAWVAWVFVHLAFLAGAGSRASTFVSWLGSIVGHRRQERDFSVGRTAGDVSVPDEVRAKFMPNRFPAADRERS